MKKNITEMPTDSLYHLGLLALLDQWFIKTTVIFKSKNIQSILSCLQQI